MTGTFFDIPTLHTISGVGNCSVSPGDPDSGSIFVCLAPFQSLGSGARTFQMVNGAASRSIWNVWGFVGGEIDSPIQLRDTFVVLPGATRSCIAEWLICERVTKVDWMMASLGRDIRSQTITHEGSTTLLVYPASCTHSKMNARIIQGTIGKPNTLQSGISSTQSLCFGGPRGTGAIVF